MSHSADQDTRQTTACYVYGVIPADVEVDDDVRGVADPPARVQVVRRGRVAALVSKIAVEDPLGKPEDLVAHDRVLNLVVAAAPVLPMRFGAVATSTDVVATELLDAHHDELAATLDDLEGHAEYIIHGRYDGDAILTEVLRENPAAMRLRDRIHDLPDEQTTDARVRLGEFIAQAIESKRRDDTDTILRALEPYAVDVRVRDPSHEDDAIYVALLAETARQSDIEGVIGRLAEPWEGRISLRLLGPLAAFDFVAVPGG
jgi:hypothetical protein